MKVVNFGHPLTEANLNEIAALVGEQVTEVVEVPSQFDLQSPLEPQVRLRLDEVDWRQWQSEPVLFNLPSLNYSAAVILVLLHGLRGCFPPVLRLAPEAGSLIPRYVVKEIVNLQAVRERARERRQ